MAIGKFCGLVEQQDDLSPSLLYYKASLRCCDSAHAASPCPRLLYPMSYPPFWFLDFLQVV